MQGEKGVGKLVRKQESGFNGLLVWMSLKETGKRKPLRGLLTSDKSRVEDEVGTKGNLKNNREDPDEPAKGVGEPLRRTELLYYR